MHEWELHEPPQPTSGVKPIVCRECLACQHSIAAPMCKWCKEVYDYDDYQVEYVDCTDCGGRYCLECEVDTTYLRQARACSHFDENA